MTLRSYPVGLSRDETHRYFWAVNDAVVELPSVTTVLRVLDKSGPLIGWAKRITAEAAIDNRAELDKWMELGGRDGAVGLLTKAATVKRDRAANAGSEVHALAEAIARGQDVEVAPEIAPLVDAYRSWLAEWQPEFLAAEEMVLSLEHGYAGTLDAIVRIAGETWLIDYKTSKGVYPETGLQLAAYAKAEHFGRPGVAKRFRIPPIDNYGVLHLTVSGYEVVPYDVTAETYAAFLDALHLWRWTEGQAKTVMGQPIGRVPTFQARAKEAVA
jgi:hypothetical protein